MSQESVDLVRRWYASLPDLAAADPADDEATLDQLFADYLDEGYEIRLPADYPEGEHIFRRREGLIRYLAMLRDAFSEWHFEAERILDADDQVVVFQRVIGKGKTGEVPFEMTGTSVLTVVDGRLRASEVYRDRSQALKAAGLEP
jgi:ketosteroid isomerase-like protein